jgi:hypothetical protein
LAEHDFKGAPWSRTARGAAASRTPKAVLDDDEPLKRMADERSMEDCD